MMIDPYSFYNPYQQRKRKKARYGAINSPQGGGVNRSGLLDRGGYDNRGKQGYQKAKIDRGKISTKYEDKPEEGGGFGGIMAAKEAYESGKEAYDVLSQLGSEEGRKKLYDICMTKGEEFGAKLDQFGENVQSGINKATDFARNPMGYGKYTEPTRYSPGFGPDPQTGFGSEGISMVEGQRLRQVPTSAPTGLGIPMQTNEAVSQSLGGINTGNLATGGSEALKQSSNLLQGAGGLGQASSYPLQIGGKGIEQTYRAAAQSGAGAGTTAGTEVGKQAAKEVSKEGGKQAVSGMSSSTIGAGIAMGTIALEVAMGETQDKLTGSHEADTAVRLVAAYYTAGFSELFYAFI